MVKQKRKNNKKAIRKIPLGNFKTFKKEIIKNKKGEK